MSRLHPSLEKLLPVYCANYTSPISKVPVSYTLTPEDITAFALAVARAEQARCLAAVTLDGSAAIYDLPDPTWSTP